MKSQRKIGITLSYISMFIGIVVGLLNVKIINNYVSMGDLGVYSTLGSLIAVMSVLDLGFASTMVRYYTKSLALSDKNQQENTLATGSIIYAFISILIIGVGFAVFPLIEKIYGVTFTSSELILAKQMFVIMLINLVLSISTNIYNAVLTAREKFVFINCVNIVKSIFGSVLIYVFLYKTKDILFVVIIYTLINITGIIAKIVYTHSKLKVKIKYHYFDKVLFGAISAFAFFIFLNMIMDKIYWSTDNLILSAVVGPALTAVYARGSTLTTYYLNFSSQIASVFLPQITSISVKSDDMKELNEIFLKVGRVQYIIVMLILSGFIIFGKEFITEYWLNRDFESAYNFALILMIPLVIPLIQNTGISILQAKNKHKFRSIVYFFIAVINFCVSIPLAKIYGGYGCAIATAGSLILGQWIIINIYYKKKIGINIGTFFRNIIKMTPPIFFVAFLGYFINIYIPNLGIVAYLVKVMVYIIAYFLIVKKFACNSYEKQIFNNLIRLSFIKKERNI